MDAGIYLVIFMGFFLGVTWLFRIVVNEKLSQKINQEQKDVWESNTEPFA